MNPEQVDRLIDLIVTIGGQMASDGFAIAMRRVVYEAYVEFFWAAFVGAICLACICAAMICRKKHIVAKESNECYDDEWLFVMWILWSLAPALLVVGISVFLGGLDMLYNPEWHAVQMLMGLL